MDIEKNVDWLVKRLSEKYNLIDYNDIFKKIRNRPMPEIRAMIYKILKDNHSLTLNKKGELLGGFDHSTVNNAIKFIFNNLYSTDKEYKKLFNLISSEYKIRFDLPKSKYDIIFKKIPDEDIKRINEEKDKDEIEEISNYIQTDITQILQLQDK